MEREHFDDLALHPPPPPPAPSFSRAIDKKNHSEFSIFWDIINSWLDIQIGSFQNSFLFSLHTERV